MGKKTEKIAQLEADLTACRMLISSVGGALGFTGASWTWNVTADNFLATTKALIISINGIRQPRSYVAAPADTSMAAVRCSVRAGTQQPDVLGVGPYRVEVDQRSFDSLVDSEVSKIEEVRQAKLGRVVVTSRAGILPSDKPVFRNSDPAPDPNTFSPTPTPFIAPPSHPTTLGDVWIGETKPMEFRNAVLTGQEFRNPAPSDDTRMLNQLRSGLGAMGQELGSQLNELYAAMDALGDAFGGSLTTRGGPILEQIRAITAHVTALSLSWTLNAPAPGQPPVSVSVVPTTPEDEEAARQSIDAFEELVRAADAADQLAVTVGAVGEDSTAPLGARLHAINRHIALLIGSHKTEDGESVDIEHETLTSVLAKYTAESRKAHEEIAALRMTLSRLAEAMKLPVGPQGDGAMLDWVNRIASAITVIKRFYKNPRHLPQASPDNVRRIASIVLEHLLGAAQVDHFLRTVDTTKD